MTGSNLTKNTRVAFTTRNIFERTRSVKLDQAPSYIISGGNDQPIGTYSFATIPNTTYTVPTISQSGLSTLNFDNWSVYWIMDFYPALYLLGNKAAADTVDVAQILTNTSNAPDYSTVKLYLLFVANYSTVTVQFINTYGNAISPLTVNPGPVTLPSITNIPVNVIFIDWIYDSTTYSAGGSFTAIKNTSPTFTAEFGISVRYMVGNLGGAISVVNTVTGKLGSSIDTFVPTTPSGQAFSGWIYNSVYYAAGSQIVLPSRPDSNQLTLVGYFQPNIYTVSFINSSTGSGTLPITLNILPGHVLIVPGVSGSFNGASFSLTAPSGYTFGGWTDGKTIYASGNSYRTPNPPGNITLAVVWVKLIIATFTIGNGTGTAPASNIQAMSTVIVLPGRGALNPPTARPYTVFTGWDDGSADTYVTTYNLVKDVTLAAVWGYTIRYDLNSGSGTTPYQQPLGTGKIFTVANLQTSDFVFWTDNFNRKCLPGSKYTVEYSNVIFTATYNNTAITFNPGTKFDIVPAGTMSPTISTIGNSFTMPVATYTPPSQFVGIPINPDGDVVEYNFINEQSVFSYWTDSLLSNKWIAGENYIIKDDVTFTANWDTIFHIRFSLGIGSGLLEPVLVKNNTVIKLPDVNSVTPPNSDLQLVSWYDGTNEYAPGAYYTVDRSKTFGAHYATLYNVTYLAGRLSNEPVSFKITYGSSFLLQNYIIQNQTGWTDGTQICRQGDLYTVYADTVIDAFISTPYTVSYELNGLPQTSCPTAVDTVVLSDTVAEPAVVNYFNDKTNQIFAGWLYYSDVYFSNTTTANYIFTEPTGTKYYPSSLKYWIPAKNTIYMSDNDILFTAKYSSAVKIILKKYDIIYGSTVTLSEIHLPELSTFVLPNPVVGDVTLYLPYFYNNIWTYKGVKNLNITWLIDDGVTRPMPTLAAGHNFTIQPNVTRVVMTIMSDHP